MSEQTRELVMPHSIDVEEAQLVFSIADGLNARIGDQNERFKEITTVFADDTEIRDLAVRGVADEQQETVFELSELDEESGDMYRSIGLASLTSELIAEANERDVADLEKDSDAKTKEIESLTQELKDQEGTKLALMLENVKRLSPTAVANVEALLASRTQSAITSHPHIQELEEEALELLSAVDLQRAKIAEDAELHTVIDGLMSEGGKAWSLPQALIYATEQGLSQQTHLDELPVEPKLSSSSHERFSKLRGSHIDEPEASLYIAFYLSERQNETVTVGDVANFLYTDDVRTRVGTPALRTRVTTLLGPARGYVDGILQSEGYTLQYGWRRTLEKSDKGVKITGISRIYRVIPTQQVAQLEPGKYTEDGEGFIDEFTIKPVEAKVSGQLEPLEAVEPAAEATPVWVKPFRIQVGEALQKLEEIGLLESPEAVTIKHVRNLHPSRRLFTDTGIDRLIKADLLPFRNVGHEGFAEEELKISDLVVATLHNERKGPLRKGSSHRDEALQIIQESVEAYFYNKQARAK